MVKISREQTSVLFQDFANPEEVFLVIPHRQNSQRGAGSFGSGEPRVTIGIRGEKFSRWKDGKWPTEPALRQNSVLPLAIPKWNPALPNGGQLSP